MKVVFVRHGAKRNNEADPSLTFYGKKMSVETGEWLKKNGHLPDKVICSGKKRTKETAYELLNGCGRKLNVSSEDLPEEEDDWNDYLNLLSLMDEKETTLLVGHHPTMLMLIEQYGLEISIQNFASAVVLKKISNGVWECADSWPGKADYS